MWVVWADRHPFDPPHLHGAESVRSGEAELAQHREAQLTTRRRKMRRVGLLHLFWGGETRVLNST